MGYRHYFFKAKIEDVDRVKNLTPQEIDKICSENDNDMCFGIEKILYHKGVFEFGKLYWDDTSEQIYRTGVPLFNNKKSMEMFEDFVPYVVGKAGLLKSIEIYQNKIIKYFEDCMTDTYDEFRDTTCKSEDKIKNDINDRLYYWKNNYVLSQDENDKNRVTKSWQYEYSVFNLVHLLKTIDWEKETLLFYGY